MLWKEITIGFVLAGFIGLLGEDFEAPPTFVDLPLDGTPLTIVGQDIPAGFYKELEFEVEDAEVDASAAGGAGLDLQPRVQRPDPIEEAVDGRGVLVDVRASVVDGLDEIAVLVPFDVVEPVFGDERGDRVDGRLPRHILQPRLDRRPASACWGRP